MIHSLLFAALLVQAPAPRFPDLLPVIPGAVGYGAEGSIARGRPVYRAKNTKGEGEGSLHEALLAANESGGGSSSSTQRG